MADLEKMLRDKQESLPPLRERAEDWIDRLGDWKYTKVRWYHYLIALLAYAAGYWTAWFFGV
jgi:hypothetical protein